MVTGWLRSTKAWHLSRLDTILRKLNNLMKHGDVSIFKDQLYMVCDKQIHFTLN